MSRENVQRIFQFTFSHQPSSLILEAFKINILSSKKEKIMQFNPIFNF